MSTVEEATAATRRGTDWRRIASRHGWTIGVYVLLLLLIIAYIWALAPVTFTSFDLKTIVIGGLPLAFAAMAQAVIVISGGIDLSLGVMVAVINVLAASLMEDQSFATSLLIAFGLMIVGMVMGSINGGLCVITGVPDIVVTLAMSFVWGGVALLIMRTPGGGSPLEYQALGTGVFGFEWIPAGAVVIALVLALVWLPIRWRRPGFAIYAIGSNRDRAYLSGVNVATTRVLAYAIGGFFAAMGGLAATATTGIGTPVRGHLHHAELGRGDRARRREPGRRQGRRGRARRGRVLPHAGPLDHGLPGHRPELRPGHPGRPDRDRRHARRPAAAEGAAGDRRRHDARTSSSRARARSAPPGTT